MELGRIGIWWSRDGLVEAAPEIEELGYGALWMSGGFSRGVMPHFGQTLAVTSRIIVASGIIGVWKTPAGELAHSVARLEASSPGRFLLGLGVSHAPIVEYAGIAYERPFDKMVSFLDELDGSSPTVAPERRALAALGPKMLRLSAERSLGAHPYFVPVEHTIYAREVLGAGPLLAPEVAVVLESDAGRAREIARKYAATYLPLPNYAGNLRRLGYKEEDVALPGSNQVIDAVIPWGGLEKVAARLTEHLEAGADHICIQVLTGEARFPLEQYRLLAQALITPTK